MSVVTGVRKGSVAAIAADTLYTMGDRPRRYGFFRDTSKLVALPHGGFVGVVGSTTNLMVMRSLVREHPKKLKLTSIDTIFRSLLDLQPILEERYRVRIDEDDDEQPYDSNQLELLVVNPHGIFHLLTYREVIEVDRFWAIGSGADVALGAMHALYDRIDDPLEIARAGALAAAELEITCGPPIEAESVDLLA
ncbi:MAG: MFS transporter [Alphaproteobacteria bacterium]|nr:MFS transporter [Alphaproteobacteria bacterium]MCB9692553.1 MFS transporter [Alphaproteobacteria bacterium]